MSPPIDASLLKTFSAFEQLTLDEARAASSLLECIDLKSGETLFTEGDECGSVYLVISGSVEIHLTPAGYDRHNLVTLGPGSILGEMGPLTSEPRGATAVAAGNVRLAALPCAAFKAAFDRGERWTAKFLMATARVLAHRLAALNKELVSAVGKLAACRSEGAGKAVDELDRLRDRLLTEWTF